MSDPSRRGFLAIAGVGAATAGLAVAAPAAGAHAPGTPPVEGASGPLVAYVTDVRSGAVSVMVGDREVEIHDRELVNRLTRAVF
jgi:hypothetical protein